MLEDLHLEEVVSHKGSTFTCYFVSSASESSVVFNNGVLGPLMPCRLLLLVPAHAQRTKD